MGLVYCDFKPDNMMLEKDDVKLIDMGGVRRMDDMQGDIYGTDGYSAPEAGEGPTASPIYSPSAAPWPFCSPRSTASRTNIAYTLPSPQEEPRVRATGIAVSLPAEGDGARIRTTASNRPTKWRSNC